MSTAGGALLVFAVAAAAPGCCATSRAWNLAHVEPVKLEQAWLDESGSPHAVVRWADGSTTCDEATTGTPVAATLRRRYSSGEFRLESFVVTIDYTRTSLDCPAPLSLGGTIEAVLLTPPAVVADTLINVASPLWLPFTISVACNPSKKILFCAGLDDAALSHASGSDGRIALESKDKTRDRVGRSPDHGDALALAVAAGTSGGGLLSAISSPARGAGRGPGHVSDWRDERDSRERMERGARRSANGRYDAEWGPIDRTPW